MTLVYLVQHGEKERLPGDPGLTEAGRRQAEATGHWLGRTGLRGLYASPLRRARQTADLIAGVTGLPVQVDARLRERMNWDGGCSLESFLADWARTTRDRDFVPSTGESSRQAGDRLHAYITGQLTGAAPVAVVTHGGVTVDLLRKLMPDEALPVGLLVAGIPACAITTISDLNVESIAAIDHLPPSPEGPRDKLAWILVRHGRVLMTRNQGRELFYFPGGMREPGESDAQALAREIEEELRALIDVATLVHVVTVEAPGDGGGPQIRMICYTARHAGALVPDHEIAEHAWLSYADRDRTSPPDQLVFDMLHLSGELA